MDAFTLVAKLILDKSEYESGMAGVESEMNGMTSSGGGLTKWGVAAGQAIGTAVTKGATAAYQFAKSVITTGMSFDDVMASVRSVREMTEEQFYAVRAKALELGESTVFTATEVGEALYYMGVAGWDSQKMIAGIDGVLNLAAASGTDLATSSDIVTDALTAFGMSADDTGRFVNVLAAAAANSNTTVGMMGDAFKYIAPVAGALKYTVEDVAIGMGLMANNGIKASQSGTALRQILNGLIDPSDDAKKSMSKLGLSMYEADGRAKSFRNLMSDLRDLMRNNGFDPASSNAEKLQNSLSDLADAYESGSISAEEYATRQAALSKQMGNAEFMKSISDIVGVRGLPALLAIMKATDEEWDELAKSIDNSEGEAARMASERLNTLQGDLTLLNSALDGLKVLLSDEYKNKIREFINGITEEIGKLSQAFNEGGLAGMFNNLTKWIVDGITDTLKSADFAEGAGQFGKALGDFVGNLVQSLVKNGSELMSGLFDAGVNLAGGLIEGLFSGLFGTGDDSIGYFLEKAQNDQKNAIDKANQTATEAQGIVGYMQSLIDKYGEAARSTDEWADALERIKSLVPAAGDIFSQEADSLSDMVSNLSEYVEQLRQLSVQQAKQNALESYRNKYYQNQAELGSEMGRRDFAESTMQTARQTAYDLMNKARENGAWWLPSDQTPEDIDMSSIGGMKDFQDAMDLLSDEERKGWTAEGIQDAYTNAEQEYNDSTQRIKDLSEASDKLRQQMEMAEQAVGDMGDNAEDTADQTEDLGDIADEAGAIDTSGLQGSLDNAASALDTASGQISGMASGAHIDTGGLQSSINEAASAMSGLAAAASSVSFAGLGGGTLGGGVGPAPTVGRFAKGAWEIPYDEYPAMLHRGEMVLTASQARKYRSGEAGDLSPETLYQAVAGAVQQAVANIQINMDGVSVGNAVTKQVSKNLYKDQYGRRFATV